MKILVLFAILSFAATATPSPVQADSAMRVCVGPLQSQGLEPEEEEKVRAALDNQLAARGAHIPVEVCALALDPGCLDNPSCVTRAASGARARGLLDLRVVRFGPTVRWRARLFDASTGSIVVEKETSLSSTGFPGTLSLGDEVTAGLDSLRSAAEMAGVADATATSGAGLPPGSETTADTRTLTARADPEQTPADDAAASGGTISGDETDTDREMWQIIGWSTAVVGAGMLLGGVASGVIFVSHYSLKEDYLDEEDTYYDKASTQEQRDAALMYLEDPKREDEKNMYDTTGILIPTLFTVGTLLTAGGVAAALLMPLEEASEAPASLAQATAPLPGAAGEMR